MKPLVLFSPAKINLYLEILGRRPDGYHDLRTVFERISLSDTIRLTRTAADGITVSCRHPDVPCDETNIAYKAADLLRRRHGVRGGFHIHIEKRIPVGGGLGGGSSNAAAVLAGINRLLRLKISPKTLLDYANELGSDVAFFVLGRPFALGEGKGGDLTPLGVPSRLKLWHLLFLPPLKILTKEVYERLKTGPILKLTKSRSDVNILFSYLSEKDIPALNRSIYNRLSEVVYTSYSLVSDLKTDLCKFGLDFVHMSGSGPTLFSVFSAETEARKAYQAVRRRFSDRCRVFLTHTC